MADKPRDIRPGQREAQTTASLVRNLPRLAKSAPREGVMAIVGGGPSVADHVDRIREANAVTCVNHVHDWLIGQDIIPDFCVLYEIVEPKTVGITPHPDVTYMIASQCNETIFDHFRQSRVMMWHVANAATDKVIQASEPQAQLVRGGATTIVRALNVSYIMGWRDFVAVGVDSSFEDQSHVYGDANPDCVGREFGGKTYKTTKIYAKQAEEVVRFRRNMPNVTLKIYGRGLLPDMYQQTYGD